jgi:hypothetical protein
MRRQYGEMIDRMFPGPKIVTWLPHWPGRGGDRNSLVGVKQFIAVVLRAFFLDPLHVPVHPGERPPTYELLLQPN